MKRILVLNAHKTTKTIDIPEDEAHHLVQVTRVNIGESIEILNGRGESFKAILQRHGKKWVATDLTVHLLGTEILESVFPIRLEIAILKGDAMGWVFEKAVELGCAEVQPIITRYGVVRIKLDDQHELEKFNLRWQKTADQALKQCGRVHQLKVLPPKALETVFTDSTDFFRLWLDEKADPKKCTLLSLLNQKKPKKLSLLVGPEGGFSPEELALLQNNATSCSLGALILRSETAAITALATSAQWYRSLKS